MKPFVRTDVTAVSLHEEYIVTGIGSNLYIYDRNTSKQLNEISLLNGQKVHGIIWKNNNSLLAYGGKQLVIVCLRKGKSSVNVDITNKLTCDDWILHAISTLDDKITILTAHNVVQEWGTKVEECVLCESTACVDNSLLYSGRLVALRDAALVLAGTVYSHVLVRHTRTHSHNAHTLSGHKGVIFSIQWDENKEIIVTTSDDRSVRIWNVNSDSKHSARETEYWDTCRINCGHVLYGHTSRVMRCAITSALVISVGEDSHICFWNLDGKLTKRIRAHQSGCIWSVDADSSHVVTGGSDSAVVLLPLTVASEDGLTDRLHLGNEYGVPKKIMFTARGNVATYHTNNMLRYYDIEAKSWKDVAKYDSAYKMFSLSSCKQLIAVIDACGKLDVFAENCKGNPGLKAILSTKIDTGRVCSLNWAGNRFLVFCNSNGEITLAASDCSKVCSFLLPPCKERWLTSTAVNPHQNMFVFGDRCGNIHFYSKGNPNPIKTFRKVHGPYGATSLTWESETIASTGRDGTIRHFSVTSNQNSVDITQMDHIKLPFEWVERVINKEPLVVCGFDERNFVVYDVECDHTLIDLTCGGGHRAWDIRRYYKLVDQVFREFIVFIFVKESAVTMKTFRTDKITRTTVVSGTHVKEVNALRMIAMDNDDVLFIGGGEDTTLRVSTYNNSDHSFSDNLIFKQLSNIRTVAYQKLCSGDVLLFYGGGRASIGVKVIKLKNEENKRSVESENILHHQINGTDAQRRIANAEMDPETRIMSIDTSRTGQNTFVLTAGCSDSVLRVFIYDHNERSLKTLGQLTHHSTCILVVRYFEFNHHKILFTSTTRGIVFLWDFSKISNLKNADLTNCSPMLTLHMGSSGINSLCATNYKDDLLICTGGDDNAVTLVLLREEDEEMKETSRWREDGWHSAQVTGVEFAEECVVTAGIDQRVSIARVKVERGEVSCEFVQQLCTDVADVQGVQVMTSHRTVSICVYGKGLQTINVNKTMLESDPRSARVE